MSLEDVKEEIVRKAKREAESIIKAARAEEKEILDRAKAKADELKKEKEAIFSKETALIKKKADAANELEEKKAVLTERKNIIDETFELANKKLTKIPKADMKKKIDSLIKKAGEEIEIDHVYCSKKDAGLVDLKTKESDISGGIIAENKEGNVSVDLCFETLLSEIKEKKVEEISKKLF